MEQTQALADTSSDPASDFGSVSDFGPDTPLGHALDRLRRSPQAMLPIYDPETGQILAVLSRPLPAPPPVPPRLGGMATPLGVYLTDGQTSGGAGFWGLVLTGMILSGLGLAAQAGAQAAMQALWHAAPGAWTRFPYLTVLGNWLPLPLVFLGLRLLPLSGTHAAEHQVVHCIERSRPLLPECVRAMPRVHPRCGTNLFVGFSLFLSAFVGVFSAAQAARFSLPDAATVAVMIAAPLALLFWRRLGGWVQQWFATRPATDRQIASAIRAAEEVLCRRHSLAQAGGRVQFHLVRRIWSMGLAQVLLGYFVVLGLLSLASLIWPRLTGVFGL